MGVRAFHPGLDSSVGVRSRQPRRRVLEVGDRNPEALSLDVPLLSAQSPAPQVDPTAYSGGDGWRDHFSDFLKSRVGQLLGSGSLPELQRGVAQDLAGLAMPPTPGGQMAAPRVAGYVEGALDLGRPLALADLGVSGPGGMMMLPFPGLGAADDVARPVVKMGRGVTEDALRGMREALKRADSGSLASFWDEAKAGRIRSGIPVRGEQHELWSVAESAQNHVGMGRLAGYSEADIKRWYLHNAIADSLSNPGVMAEFDGMTGLKRGDVVASNQERVKNVSSAVLARARAQYERDLFSWDKTVDAAQATSQVAKVADAVARPIMSQGFLGDARLAPTRNIGEGVTVSEVAATRTDLSPIGQIGGPTPDARPFVVVRKADGSLQPFYQSTGDNSGMAGAWLPFDGFGGVVNDTFHKSWYRKNRFGQGGFARGTPLHRFGSEENKTLSELLGRELGDAEPTILFDMEGVNTELIPGMSYEDLNDALGTHRAFEDYERAIR